MGLRRNCSILLLCWLPASVSLAAGPIDGQASLNWWANDLDPDFGDGELDAGAVGGEAELWWNQRWGLKGALYRSDLADAGSAGDVDYFSLDLKRRLISPTENNFIAAGLGYEHLDLRGGDTRGVRLVLEGRVSLVGTVWAYGQSAWMPVFDDTAGREDQDALELELGVGFSPLPFVTVSAGWRKFALDFTDTATGSGRKTTASGPLFEAGLKW